MELTANAIQTVAEGANVLFTDEVTSGNCSILHRDGSGLVTLRGLTNQCRARFRVSFGGNIAVPTGETVGGISVAIALGGEILNGTIARVTPAAVEEYFNVAMQTLVVVNCNCCATVAVRNNSDIPILVDNPNINVVRVS